MNLREVCIEAGAKALAESYSPDIGVLPWEQQAPYWRKQARAGLDAFLSCLSENADEWDESAGVGNAAYGYVRDLLAVLRSPV